MVKKLMNNLRILKIEQKDSLRKESMNWTELSIIINHEAVELATNILENHAIKWCRDRRFR